MAKRQILHTLILLTLFCAITVPRIFSLETFQTADEAQWMHRTHEFSEALKERRWTDMYHTQTPGITLMWIGMINIESQDQHMRKLPLALAHILLIICAGYVLYRLWGIWHAYLLTALLAIEPLLIAHSRVYGMDAYLSLFLVLWIGLLLLWIRKRTYLPLLLSSVCAALAVMSKLPGIIAVPITLMIVGYEIAYRRQNTKEYVRTMGIWTIAYILTLIITLPALAIDPGGIIQHIHEMFSVEGYTTTHREGPLYYLRTLTFFSTPLQYALLALIPIAWKHIPKDKQKEILIILLCAGAFIIMMSIGAKKGHRYILPAFLLITTAAVPALIALTTKTKRRIFAICLISFLIGWQIIDIARLHPYTIAYMNPVTKHFYGDRRSGWGEGLDRAATYLNAKENAKELHVASYYPNEFGAYFDGAIHPLHRWNDKRIDYIVLYRTALERGEDSEEQRIIQHLNQYEPEHVITLNGIWYASIWRAQDVQ